MIFIFGLAISTQISNMQVQSTNLAERNPANLQWLTRFFEFLIQGLLRETGSFGVAMTLNPAELGE